MADRVAHEVKVFVVEQLRARQRDGELTTAGCEAAAEALDCSPRSIFRWIKNGVPTPTTTAFEVDEDLIDLYYEKRGNVVRVHEELLKRAPTGGHVPSRPTLDRAYRRALRPAERSYVRVGVEAWRKEQGVTRRQVTHRNEIWEADDKQLPIYAVLKRGTRPFKPWVTLFVDVFTRAIMGWVVAVEQPSRAEVIAALRAAIALDPDEGPFCGIPYAIRWDNGRNFTSKDTTMLAVGLGCDIRPTPPYTPQNKGTVERVNGTLGQMLGHLPFNGDGPKRRDGSPFGPDVDPLPIQSLVDELSIVVRTYNLERPHRALGGRTPLEAWESDLTPIRTLDTDILRYELPRVTRKVTREGISYEGQLFWAPELRGIIHEQVEIRYLPYDLRQVEVFHAGEWLCTAKPHDRATPEELRRFHDRNRDERKKAGARMQRLSRKSRARLAPLHQGSDLEVVSPISLDGVKDVDRAGRSLQREARFTLILGGAGSASRPDDASDDETEGA